MNNNPITKPKLEKAKKVTTFDQATKKPNGYLIELFKNENKTDLYLTSIAPGGFKGYHEHKIRAGRYYCIKGKVKIILYINNKRREYELSADTPQRLFIPPGIPNGLLNTGREEAVLINYPLPAYDPELKNEQLDYSREEMEK